MTSPDLTEVDAVRQELESIILEITNELLDEYYDARPRSNAFGTEYEANANTPDGMWFIGRENGSDGAEDDSGVDFIYRRFVGEDDRPGDQSYEYLYGKYGWPNDDSNFLDEARLFTGVVETAADDGYVSDHHVERLELIIEQFEEVTKETRRSFTLDDISELIHSHEIDMLRRLLVEDDEEGRVIWQLLFSKDKDGETIENDIEIPVLSEEDGLLFSRAERFFYDEDDEEGKQYAYGVIIGYDDTDEVFFVHRLQSDDDLRDPEFEWTVGAVKEKMGYDVNYEELVTGNLPLDTVVRLQGDLAVRRLDYRTAYWERFESLYEDFRGRYARGRHLDEEKKPIEEFFDAHPRFKKSSERRCDLDVDEYEGLYIRKTGDISVNISKDFGTDELKALQDDLGIEEETVRDEQEARGIQRLTAKRRRHIIEDIVLEQVFDWMYDNSAVMPEKEAVEQEAEEQVSQEFEDVHQVNFVFGNHAVIVGPATRHPRGVNTGDSDGLGYVVVPDTASCYIYHDEHQSKKVTFEEGVYEFRFLEGFEDQHWMN